MSKINKLKEELAEKVQQKYPKAVLRYVEVENNNGLRYEGVYLNVSKQYRLVPVIALEQFLEGYCTGELSADDILEKLVKLTEEPVLEVDIPELEDYKQIKNRLSMKLISKDMNTERLKKLPYIPFLDMAIIFLVELFEEHREMKATYTVTWKNIEDWGVTIDELYQKAYQNLVEKNSIRFYSMLDTIERVTDEVEDDVKKFMEGSFIYILSNDCNCNGAVAILFKEKLQEFAEKIGGRNFYIVPSSTHELLLLPESVGELEELVQIVKEVNDSVVSWEDILSYHVYKYDCDKGRVLDLCA